MATPGDQIAQQIVEFIRKEFANGGSVEADTQLPQGVLDSLGIFTLVAFVENKFAVTLEDKDLTVENFLSARALTKLVESHQARAPAA